MMYVALTKRRQSWRFSLRVTGTDRIRNKYIRGTVQGEQFRDEETRLWWRDSEYIQHGMLKMELKRGRTQWRFMGVVKEDMLRRKMLEIEWNWGRWSTSVAPKGIKQLCICSTTSWLSCCQKTTRLPCMCVQDTDQLKTLSIKKNKKQTRVCLSICSFNS